MLLTINSTFFKSCTTLELTPGMHEITENVGHLVITDVSHFILNRAMISID